MHQQHALVTLSGGQDSVTALGWALSLFKTVSAVSFNYGQRHAIELECAMRVCQERGIRHQVVDIPFFGKLATSALTGDGDVNLPHARLKNVPASFVPNRNGMLLLLAHSVAQEIGADILVGGMCQTDFSGYPDCRENFVHNFVACLNLGSGTDIQLQTPLMHLDKAQTFALAQSVGFLDVVLTESHTCYEGDHSTAHDWGYGCGVCPACTLRAAGFQRWKDKDFQPLPDIRYQAAALFDLPAPCPATV